MTLNATTAGPARRTTLNGRPHLTVPVVALVPGVLPGSRGPLMYPADEVAKTHKAWEGMPLTLRHPHTPDGRPTTARAAGVLDRFGVGVLRTVALRAADGALRGEAWFDEERLKAADPVIYAAVSNGTPVEVSTGLFTDNTPAPAGARCPRTGRGYGAVARNHRPDHLAVLPDQAGACSIRDGCGLNVNGGVAAVMTMNSRRRVTAPRVPPVRPSVVPASVRAPLPPRVAGVRTGPSAALTLNYRRGSAADVVDAQARGTDR